MGLSHRHNNRGMDIKKETNKGGGIVSTLPQRGKTIVQTRQVFCNYLDLFTMHSSYHTDLWVCSCRQGQDIFPHTDRL